MFTICIRKCRFWVIGIAEVSSAAGDWKTNKERLWSDVEAMSRGKMFTRKELSEMSTDALAENMLEMMFEARGLSPTARSVRPTSQDGEGASLVALGEVSISHSPGRSGATVG